ncbi:hypothetical protein [Pseudomonas sp.]|uniref:hypothetical protein n=1 Tax=Pseudomonas sp. TaxID=306 RepID=UPI003C74E6E7
MRRTPLILADIGILLVLGLTPLLPLALPPQLPDLGGLSPTAPGVSTAPARSPSSD